MSPSLVGPDGAITKSIETVSASCEHDLTHRHLATTGAETASIGAAPPSGSGSPVEMQDVGYADAIGKLAADMDQDRSGAAGPAGARERLQDGCPDEHQPHEGTAGDGAPDADPGRTEPGMEAGLSPLMRPEHRAAAKADHFATSVHSGLALVGCLLRPAAAAWCGCLDLSFDEFAKLPLADAGRGEPAGPNSGQKKARSKRKVLQDIRQQDLFSPAQEAHHPTTTERHEQLNSSPIMHEQPEPALDGEASVPNDQAARPAWCGAKPGTFVDPLIEGVGQDGKTLRHEPNAVTDTTAGHVADTGSAPDASIQTAAEQGGAATRENAIENGPGYGFCDGPEDRKAKETGEAVTSFPDKVVDPTAPVLTNPGTVTVGATSVAGVAVTSAATATDAVKDAEPVTFSKSSGSSFTLRTTTVTETAIDAAGNTAPTSFKDKGRGPCTSVRNVAPTGASPAAIDTDDGEQQPPAVPISGPAILAIVSGPKPAAGPANQMVSDPKPDSSMLPVVKLTGPASTADALRRRGTRTLQKQAVREQFIDSGQHRRSECVGDAVHPKEYRSKMVNTRDRVSYRKPVDRSKLPRWYRRAAAEHTRSKAVALKDYGYSAVAAGIDPFPITSAKVSAVGASMSCAGSKSAHKRELSWRAALDILDASVKERAGLTETLQGPRGVRTINDPAGTFPQLELDIERVAQEQSRPRTSICEDHDPVDVEYVRAQGRRILVAATRVRKDGVVDRLVDLAGFLHPRNQEAHLAHIDALDASGDEPTWVADTLGAIRFFALRVHGPESDEARCAAAQQQARCAPHQMTEGRILVLMNLMKQENLKKVRNIPHLLLARAETTIANKGTKYRESAAKSLNLAAGIAVEQELLLRTSNLISLATDHQGMPILPCDDACKAEPLQLSRRTTELLTRRAYLLAIMEVPSEHLFPGRVGDTAVDRTVIRSVQKVMQEHGLPGVTLEVLRDLGALLLLRNDHRQIRRVRALLDLASFESVRKRFHPFLRGDQS